MNDHAAQPCLCETCLALIHSKAEACPLGDRVMHMCDCRGPESVMLAVGSTKNHAIVHWHCEGPMTKAQGMEVSIRIIEQFKRAGMSIHKIQTQ